MIRAEDLVVLRGGTRILDGVSMQVPAGRLTAVLGRNGAGKSTLVGALAGDLPADAGGVTIAGLPVERRTLPALARVRAVLSQHCALDFPFTALEVTLLGRTPQLAGRPRDRDLEIALAALEAAGVAHLHGRSYPTLSGGERQRVQLARSLAQIWDAPADGRCWILDEPTASLDMSHQHTALRLARKLADDGAAVLAILHEPNLAARYADELVLLDAGRVAAAGGADEVLSPARLEEVFGVRAEVHRHPEHDCPLVVVLGPHEPADERMS